MRIRQSLTLALALIASTGLAQQPAPTTLPVYDVVSIHENKSNSDNAAWQPLAQGFTAENFVFQTYLLDAYMRYHLRPELISGLPAWATSVHYNITAKASDADPETLRKLPSDQRDAMLLALLRDRFHLQSHIEIKTLPTYDLVIDKSGSKLKPSADPMHNTMATYRSRITVNGGTLEPLIANLPDHVGRAVIDKTGLTGKYDYTLKWSTVDQATTANDPDIFTAVEEQLGLKLVPSKGPVETLVVDHVDPPTPN